MDLGFGSTNQTMGNAAASAILAQTTAQEQALQQEISNYDALLNANDTELEQIREKRLAQMKKSSLQKQRWRENGHGTYTDIGQGQHGGDVAKEFFDLAKQSERLIVHFHRPSTRLCDVFHSHLAKIAPKHLESRFVKINVDQCSADGGGGGGATFLVEKLGIVVMPTILIVKNRKAEHHLRGFDELGGTEDFSTEALEFVLGHHGGLTLPPGTEPPEDLTKERGVNDLGLIRKTATAGGVKSRRGRGAYGTSEDYEDDE